MQELTMNDILKATKSEPAPGLFPASGHRYARVWVTGVKDGSGSLLGGRRRYVVHEGRRVPFAGPPQPVRRRLGVRRSPEAIKDTIGL